MRVWELEVVGRWGRAEGGLVNTVVRFGDAFSLWREAAEKAPAIHLRGFGGRIYLKSSGRKQGFV